MKQPSFPRQVFLPEAQSTLLNWLLYNNAFISLDYTGQLITVPYSLHNSSIYISKSALSIDYSSFEHALNVLPIRQHYLARATFNIFLEVAYIGQIIP